VNISPKLIKVILSDSMNLIEAQVHATGKMSSNLSREVIRMALGYESRYGEPLRHATAHELVEYNETLAGRELYCPDNVLTDYVGDTELRRTVESVRMEISKHRKHGKGEVNDVN
jgi:hypothetical protein